MRQWQEPFLQTRERLNIYDPDSGERRPVKMKEVYETPQLEIIEFEAEDVITTSGVYE